MRAWHGQPTPNSGMTITVDSCQGDPRSAFSYRTLPFDTISRKKESPSASRQARFRGEQVEGEVVVHRQADARRLVEFIPGQHDDQDVPIAIAVRLTVGMGAEQDDLLGPEALRHLAREDHAQGDVGP
jgi:hypothetical protein